MKKYLLLLSFALLFSCEEQSIADETPESEISNVRLSQSFIYKNKELVFDSIYVNESGQRFYITDLHALYTNLEFINGSDTITNNELMTGFSASDDFLLQGVMNLPSGGYSGFYNLSLGLDSAQNVFRVPALEPEGSPLKNPIFKNDLIGYNHLIVQGKYFDPTNPNDTVGNLDFDIRIGTYELTQYRSSPALNFSVGSTGKAIFVIQTDIGLAMDKHDIAARPEIKSDPTDPADMNYALQFIGNVTFSLF